MSYCLCLRKLTKYFKCKNKVCPKTAKQKLPSTPSFKKPDQRPPAINTEIDRGEVKINEWSDKVHLNVCVAIHLQAVLKSKDDCQGISQKQLGIGDVDGAHWDPRTNGFWER